MAEQVAALKQQDGGNILKFGTGELDRTLMQHNLVDEFNLLLNPVAVGSELGEHDPVGGERIFDGFDTTHLRLVDSKGFKSGIVNLVYAPTEQE